MTTTWDEASRCPADSFTGKETRRRPLKRAMGTNGGQLVTLTCPNERCEFHEVGWTVQVRPDGTIPDAVAPGEREKNFVSQPGARARGQRIRELLAEQVELELRGDGEIRNPLR